MTLQSAINANEINITTTPAFICEKNVEVASIKHRHQYS